MLQATVVHDEHEEVDAFDADLQSPASAADGNECGSAPAFRRAAGGHATSVLAAKDEAALEQVRHHDDALGTAQDFFRNPFVGRRHDRLKNVYRFLQAIDGVFAIRTCERVGSHQAHQADQYD